MTPGAERWPVLDRIRTMTLFVCAGWLLVAAGCTGAFPEEGDGETRTDRQSVRVVPRFHLEGTEHLPEQLQLEELGLAVSEIELTPSDPNETLAYSSRAPMGLDFRVSDGEIEREGKALTLPEAGTYDVNLRLEPSGRSEAASDSDKPRARDYSMRITGYVSGDGVVRVDPREEGDEEDGRPVPFPANPDESDDDSDPDERRVSDEPALPDQWTPFEFESQSSVVYTLDRVDIDGERQVLSFSFDAQEWAGELLEPLSRAVQSDETPSEPTPGDSPVDVTQAIERLGEGPEAMEEHMSVRAVGPNTRADSQ